MFSNPKTLARITLLLSFFLILASFHIPLVGAAEDSWVSLAPMQVARSGLGVAAVNGKVYAIGGSNASGFAPSMPGSCVLGVRDNVAVNEEYDPVTDSWTFKAPMPTPRLHFAVAVYNNKIYCIGGSTENGHTGINEVYDPATDAWETRTSMPTARAGLSANVVGDKVYLIGGTTNGTLNEVYFPETDTWGVKSPSPKDTTFVVCVSAVFDQKIYVIGDISEDQNHDITQIYDTKNDTWRYGTWPPGSVDGGAAVATSGVFAPKRIYVVGPPQSLSQAAPLYSNQIYDPATDNWTVAADLPTRRYTFGVAAIDDTFYVVGGHTYNYLPGNFAPTATNEQYTPVGYIPEFPTWVTPFLLVVATVVIVFCRHRLPKRQTFGVLLLLF